LHCLGMRNLREVAVRRRLPVGLVDLRHGVHSPLLMYSTDETCRRVRAVGARDSRSRATHLRSVKPPRPRVRSVWFAPGPAGHGRDPRSDAAASRGTAPKANAALESALDAASARRTKIVSRFVHQTGRSHHVAPGSGVGCPFIWSPALGFSPSPNKKPGDYGHVAGQLDVGGRGRAARRHFKRA
jgi:hypothetical protein